MIPLPKGNTMNRIRLLHLFSVLAIVSFSSLNNSWALLENPQRGLRAHTGSSDTFPLSENDMGQRNGDGGTVSSSAKGVGGIYAQAVTAPSTGSIFTGSQAPNLPFSNPASSDLSRKETSKTVLKPEINNDNKVLSGKKTGEMEQKPGISRAVTPKTDSGPHREASPSKETRKKDKSRKAATTSQSVSAKPKFADSDIPPSVRTPVPGWTPGTGTLPPLPPALPYVSSRDPEKGFRSGAFPDQAGMVTARVPANTYSGPSADADSAKRLYGANLPSAQPVGAEAPLGGFLLESFAESGLSRPRIETPRQEQAESPSSTVFGQVTEDIKQLGTGVKDTVLRIFPRW